MNYKIEKKRIQDYKAFSYQNIKDNGKPLLTKV